jgi:hypothetical protein
LRRDRFHVKARDISYLPGFQSIGSATIRHEMPRNARNDTASSRLLHTILPARNAAARQQVAVTPARQAQPKHFSPMIPIPVLIYSVAGLLPQGTGFDG